MASAKVITRFAPSPTGFLHIGGARTALFNWLFSKHMGGEFHLRIEDTDRERSTPEATQAILDGMAWLGLSHDGEVVYQSQNADAHVAAAYQLLESGHAYRCYCTPEELEELRAAFREDNIAFRSPWRDHDGDAPDLPYTVRFKVPDGKTVITDHVQGEIEWDNKNFDDLVLLRGDSTPTYMLAVVVDDHNMGVTHVIRGDDHLINAGRQSVIYDALGWNIPEWAHVPLIHGPDGKKLSKRHGALGVMEYAKMGYLPEGLRNYLLKLGWAHGDQELFFDDEAENVFSLSGINESPARLDFDKMDHINGEHMKRADNDRLFDLAVPFLEDANHGPLSDRQATRIRAAMDTLKPRSKHLVDLARQAEYLMINRPLTLEGKAAKPLRKPEAIDHLRALILRLKDIQDTNWTNERLQSCLQSYVEDNDIGFGKIGQPVRAALTGGRPSPDLSQVLFLLGRDETLGRLDDAVNINFE